MIDVDLLGGDAAIRLRRSSVYYSIIIISIII